MRKFCASAPLLLIIAASVLSAPQDLEQVTVTVVNTQNDQTTIQFSTGTAVDQLTNIQKAQLGCLYQGGINKNTFEGCYGHNYDSLNQQYVDFFIAYKDKLIQGLRKDLEEVCPEVHKPCDDLVDFADKTILKDPNIWEDLQTLADEKKDYRSVDSVLLDEALAKFKVQYTVYLNIRLTTAKSLIDTVNSIQSYIRASKMDTDFQYDDFSPAWTLESIGIANINSSKGGNTLTTSDADQIQTQSVFSIGGLNGPDSADLRRRKLSKQINKIVQPLTKKKLTDRSFDSYNFLKKLVPEAREQKILNYYLANGMVNTEELDLAALPSVTMKQIKKNRLKLNTNRKMGMV